MKDMRLTIFEVKKIIVEDTIKTASSHVRSIFIKTESGEEFELTVFNKDVDKIKVFNSNSTMCI